MNPVYAALRDLGHAFPRQQITPDTIKVYMKHLASYPDAAVIHACELAVRSCTFFPSIHELISLMDKTAAGPDAVAEVAWAEVLREVRRVGYQRNPVFRNGQFHDPPKPVFSSPLIAETVESVGWKLICHSDEPEEVRKQFIFSFRAMRQRQTERVERGDISTDPALPATHHKAIGERTA
jgi:hypothetical protein